MAKPKFSVGQTVLCDDGMNGNEAEYILGVITEVFDDVEYETTYDIEWIDADVNEEAQVNFDENDTEKFVNLWKVYSNVKV